MTANAADNVASPPPTSPTPTEAAPTPSATQPVAAAVTPAAISAPEPTDAEIKRANLRKKYEQKGALIVGAALPEQTILPFSSSFEGLEGAGKTHIIIKTYPLPLVIVNFGDRSAVPFLYEIPEGRRNQVQVYDIQPPSVDGWDFKSAVESLKELAEIISAEGPLMRGGTFGLDGGSSWWSVMQQVFVEPKEQARIAAGGKQVGGIIYEEANNRARGVLGYVKTLGCFLAMTHQLKQDWDKDGPIPNQYSPRRNSQVPYMMEVVVRMAKFCQNPQCGAPNCQKPDHVGRKHRSRLEKLSGNTGLEGLWVNDLTFPKLYKYQTGQLWMKDDLGNDIDEQAAKAQITPPKQASAANKPAAAEQAAPAKA